jgi:uridine kinase
VSTRSRVIARIADHLAALDPAHTLRVAVDGITAAGKTTLAAELTAAVAAAGRPAVHLSMDGFHHPRAHRYRQGRDSAVGYYEDAYDVTAFAREVLLPLGPGGDGAYRSRVLDLATDETVDEPRVPAPAGGVLVVDGSFLQHRELAGLWDEVVFVDTGFAVARERGALRDADQFGGPGAALLAYDRRYHAACRLYLDGVDPAGRAGTVVGNDDVTAPVLRRLGGIAVAGAPEGAAP